MTTAAVLLAGGAGSRANLAINKVYAIVHDRPLLAYPLDALEHSESIDRIVLVARPEDRDRALDFVSAHVREVPVIVVDGGRMRQESELRGLEALAVAIETDEIDLVAIHDGARPFLSHDLLESVIRTAARFGGAIPGYVPEEPLFRAVGGFAEQLEDVRKVQTPQCFWAKPLLHAYRQADEAGFIGADTAETVERFSNLMVRIVPGDPCNLKVTFDTDLAVAEEIASAWPLRF